jgi:hypothetical protein
MSEQRGLSTRQRLARRFKSVDPEEVVRPEQLISLRIPHPAAEPADPFNCLLQERAIGG